jgi:hypothetical protein
MTTLYPILKVTLMIGKKLHRLHLEDDSAELPDTSTNQTNCTKLSAERQTLDSWLQKNSY